MMTLQRTRLISYNDLQYLISLFTNNDVKAMFAFMKERHKIEDELNISYSVKALCTASLIAQLSRYAIKIGYPLGYIQFHEEDNINRMLLYSSVKELQKYDFKLVKIIEKMYSAPKEFNNATIYGILNYVYRNYQESITVEEIADTLGHTVGYVSHLFRKHMGQNLKDYINEVKMNRAKQMLRESPEDISVITMYLGYNSQSYFTKVFKRYTGVTPTQYREKYQLKMIRGKKGHR